MVWFRLCDAGPTDGGQIVVGGMVGKEQLMQGDAAAIRRGYHHRREAGFERLKRRSKCSDIGPLSTATLIVAAEFQLGPGIEGEQAEKAEAHLANGNKRRFGVCGRLSVLVELVIW